MNSQLSKTLVISFFLMFGLSACSQTEEPVKYSKADVKLQKYQWQGALPKKSVVRVVNRFGNISTRNTNHTTIELSGIIQKIGPNAPTPEILVSEAEGVTLVEVTYKESVIDGFENRIGRMDIGVYAPQGITIEMETDFGDIKAKKHRSNLIAKTQTGKIKLATSGTINATSQGGQITANLLPWSNQKFNPVNKQRRYDILSHGGDVQIYFSPQSGLDINLQAGNAITSSSSDIQNLISKEVNNLRFVIGNSERQLTVSSNQGNIQIDSVTSKNQSVLPVAAQSLDTDIRNLPKSETWQPGDPIIEIEDGRSDKNANESPTKKKFERPSSKKKKQDEGTQHSS